MNEMTIDMPGDEPSPEELARQEALAAKVDAFGASLVKRRDEAVQARRNSGIEDEWRDAEEAYQGIDDANRGTQAGFSGKPSGPDGGYINSPAQSAGRSTVFLNITRPYVDAAAARVGDMLLPTDDTPWAIKPTPIPDSMAKLSAPPAQMAEQTIPAQPAQPEMAAGMVDPMAMGLPEQAPVDPMEDIVQQAKDAAERATKQIEDWHTECQWHAEVRKMIEDCARLGTGILKGPFPVRKLSRSSINQGGLMGFMLKSEIKPVSKCISPWKFYPDGGCGENVQDGSSCWEEDTITAKALRELKEVPGYIGSQIDKVLEMGPQGKDQGDGFVYGKVKGSDSDNYKIWYFYGIAERADLEAAGVEVPESGDVTVPCMVTLVNDVVIKASLSPLDSGEFPFDVMPWQRKTNSPWGTGIAKQISTPQRMLNAATRNMMDNAGLSAGPQIVLRRGAIVPADGKWTLTPRKIWYANEGADINAVQQAFMIINIPTLQNELQNIIQFALKMAEDVTGLPMLMQGQTGDSAPDTVGGMQLVNNNASVVLRRIARLFDDKITEPHIRRYYEWLMMYCDDEAVKGDFQIDARGSTALVERDIQNQAILQLGSLALNPAFGIDPEKWFVESLKAQRLDPKRFLMDDEKKAQMAQQQAPTAPQVEAAKIRAETDLQKTQITAQIKDKEIESRLKIADTRALGEYDRDTAYVQAENQRTQLDHQARMQELEVKRELAMLQYATQQGVSLEKVKADLAKKAMEINATKELAGLKATADLMPKPPVEPPGRAQPGMSFQQ